jgi:hypothetical protein
MKSPNRTMALLLPIAIGLAAPCRAAAADPDVSRLPGFVDGAAFCDLAGEDSEVVEVHLGPSLLSALAKGAADSKEGAALLSGLRSISACVVDLEGDKDRTAKASKLVADAEARLERQGWERLARVREKGERVNVFVLNDNDVIRGLTILIIDRDEGQTVFVNLAGTIDLAKIGEIGDTLDVPGLDVLKEGGKTSDEPGKPKKAAAEEHEP